MCCDKVSQQSVAKGAYCPQYSYLVIIWGACLRHFKTSFESYNYLWFRSPIFFILKRHPGFWFFFLRGVKIVSGYIRSTMIFSILQIPWCAVIFLISSMISKYHCTIKTSLNISEVSFYIAECAAACPPTELAISAGILIVGIAMSGFGTNLYLIADPCQMQTPIVLDTTTKEMAGPPVSSYCARNISLVVFPQKN